MRPCFKSYPMYIPSSKKPCGLKATFNKKYTLNIINATKIKIDADTIIIFLLQNADM